MRRAILVFVAAFAGLVVSESLYRLQVFRTTDALVRQDTLDPEAAHALDLLRDQYADEQTFLQALSASGLSLSELRAEVARHSAERYRIEQAIAPQLGVTAEEVRQFYHAHPEQFAQPQRYRASHIFVAAPDGSPPEVIAVKQSQILGVAVRLLAGEDFTNLAAELSEDEATKLRGGDLGYFATSRMPAEFIAEVEKLRAGEVSAPIRSHLGFHIVRLTEVKPARQMAFEEVQPEIARELINVKRATNVARLASQRDTR